MKIISLAPSNTEILYALGVGDMLVGRTNQCDYPLEAGLVQSVGNWVNNANTQPRFDFLDELQPDVVMTSMYEVPELVDACKQRGITLLHVNPQTIDGIYKSILQIGKCVGEQEAALEIIRTMKSKLDSIAQESKIAITEPKRVYCEEWHTPPTVSANWVPELTAIAGGIALGRAGVYSYEITSDLIMKFDPHLIIGHWCGFGSKTRLNVITQRSGWNSLLAVKNRHVYSVDDSLLNRPGPRIWQGAEAILNLLKKTV